MWTFPRFLEASWPFFEEYLAIFPMKEKKTKREKPKKKKEKKKKRKEKKKEQF